jgi:hypothetical protein
LISNPAIVLVDMLNDFVSEVQNDVSKQQNSRKYYEIISYSKFFWQPSVMAVPMSIPIPKAIEAMAKVSW